MRLFVTTNTARFLATSIVMSKGLETAMNQNVLNIWRQNNRNEEVVPAEVSNVGDENSCKCGRELPSDKICDWLSWLAE